MTNPIYAHVPSEPPPGPTDAPPRKKPGPKPKNALQFPPPPGTPPPPRSGFHCQGCARALQPFTIELADELIRVARDRMLETQQQPTVDVLFLAARLDGYCSIGCWGHHGATEEQGKQLAKLRGE